MQANTTARHVGELKDEILRIVSMDQPAATVEISARLPESRFESVRYAIALLHKENKLKNVGRHNAYRWALPSYVTEIDPISPRHHSAHEDEEKPPKKQPKKVTPTDNLAPGTMIDKMSGVYVPTRTQPMRPGAMDHEACMSRRADGHKAYTGEFLTLGVKAK
jgi:hypothetical protein